MPNNSVPIVRPLCFKVYMFHKVCIEAIWISPGHDFKGRYGKERLHNGVLEVPEVECHAGRGLMGDRYYDFKPDFKGQITFFDKSVLDALSDHLNIPSIDASLLRRNVLIAGMDLNLLIGKRFRLGAIELSGSEECAPCFWMDEAIAPGAFEWLKGQGGLRCRIHNNSVLCSGEQSLESMNE